MTRLNTLKNSLHATIKVECSLIEALGELTLEVAARDWLGVCEQLRTSSDFKFDTCIDLCGVDYLTWENELHQASCEVAAPATPARFAVVIHLLSVEHNWRLRVRTWAVEDHFPVVPSLIHCWPSVGWFEREAFDLYGIMFDGHPDLRRILTDYGFIGHPFRKDFPLSGHVEMRYDPEQRRVVYQPVTIVPREITPRVVREDTYGIGH